MLPAGIRSRGHGVPPPALTPLPQHGHGRVGLPELAAGRGAGALAHGGAFLAGGDAPLPHPGPGHRGQRRLRG